MFNFFQAEDGIRDKLVTGVQTCALPISLSEKTFLSATIPEITLPIVIMTLVIAVLSLLYWSVLEYKLGQSLGKMLFKLYVVSETGKLTFAQTLVRNIPKTSSLLLIIDSLALL